MNSEEEKCLVRAPASLKLRDIQLFDARFDRPVRISVEEQPPARQEYMRGVQYVAGDVELDGQQHKILQFMVRLGTRVVKDVADEDPPVFFVIEATYLIEYEMTAPLDEETIKAFADYNAVHNAWPFWRQHVYDVVERARLPHLDIPLFSGINS